MVLTFELGLGATVYHLWNLRNPVLHKGCINYEEQVISAIWKLVKARIEFKNSFHSTDQIREICCRWGFAVSLILGMPPVSHSVQVRSLWCIVSADYQLALYCIFYQLDYP